MAMTPEKRVKKVAVEQIKLLSGYYFYPFSGGFGSSGVPDIVCCVDGLFIGIECKAGKNKPTELQELNLKNIKEAGGLSLVVNEKNVGHLAETITDWVLMYKQNM